MAESGGRKLLLVEDDHALAELYQARLTQAGFDVEVALDGVMALEIARKEIPDLVLLDLVLPKQNGFQVLRELKDDAAFSAIPVIILSNLGDARDIEQGEILGAAGHIVKSQATPNDVLEEVQHVLDGGRKPLQHGSVPGDSLTPTESLEGDGAGETDTLLGNDSNAPPPPEEEQQNKPLTD